MSDRYVVRYESGMHGPCDRLADGECAECRDVVHHLRQHLAAAESRYLTDMSEARADAERMHDALIEQYARADRAEASLERLTRERDEARAGLAAFSGSVEAAGSLFKESIRREALREAAHKAHEKLTAWGRRTGHAYYSDAAQSVRDAILALAADGEGR